MYVKALLPEEIQLDLSWIENTIQKHDEEALMLTWTPHCGGAWRCKLHLDDGSRMGKDVPITFKTESPNKVGHVLHISFS